MAEEATFRFVFQDGTLAGAGDRPAGTTGVPAPPSVTPQPAPVATESVSDDIAETSARFKAMGTVFDDVRATMSLLPGKTAAVASAMSATAATAGQATAAVSGLSTAAIATGGALIVLAGAALALKATISAANEKLDELAAFSGAIQQARAENRVAEIQSRIRRAQEVGPELANFDRAQAALSREWRELTDKLVELFLPLVTGLADGMTRILQMINTLAEAPEKLLEDIGELLQVFAPDAWDKKIDKWLEQLREDQRPQPDALINMFLGGLNPFAPNRIPGGPPVPTF